MSRAWQVILVVMLLMACIAGLSRAEPQSGESGEMKKEDPARASRLAAVRLSLYRLKRSIKTEGYSSARVNLNIWRSMAMDAGVFDPARYEELKRRIYDESIKRNWSCYERSRQLKNFNEALTCLQIWAIHSKEIGELEPMRYKKLKKELNELKKELNELK